MLTRIARDRYERDAVLAWQVVRVYAMAMNAKKVPSLMAVIGREREAHAGRGAQTPSQHRAAVHLLAAQYGGQVRPLQGAVRVYGE